MKKLLEAGEVYMGGQYDESDKYIAPTIIHNIQPTDPVMQEEVNLLIHVHLFIINAMILFGVHLCQYTVMSYASLSTCLSVCHGTKLGTNFFYWTTLRLNPYLARVSESTVGSRDSDSSAS